VHAGAGEKPVAERPDQGRDDDRHHRDSPDALCAPIPALKVEILVDLDVAVPWNGSHL
jgi:hypothetical protein